METHTRAKTARAKIDFISWLSCWRDCDDLERCRPLFKGRAHLTDDDNKLSSNFAKMSRRCGLDITKENNEPLSDQTL